MSSWEDAIPYFTRNELACNKTGIIRLDIRFAVHLPLLRSRWGYALTPTSVCRTPEYNLDIGGHERSLHLTENPVHPVGGTMAVDFWWEDWQQKNQKEFADLARRLGWSVGLNTQFVHVDLRSAFGLKLAVFKYADWDNRFEVTI